MPSLLVSFWTAGTRNAAGRPQQNEGSVRYSRAIEGAASRDTDPDAGPFGQRVRRQAARYSYADSARRVVLGDGAAWIWNLAYSECPAAIQVVDLRPVESRGSAPTVAGGSSRLPTGFRIAPVPQSPA